MRDADPVTVQELAGEFVYPGQFMYLDVTELAEVDIRMALYPLSAFRAMNAAALNVFRTIRTDGTQDTAIKSMQTREELYEFLGYHEFEQKLDKLFGTKE